MAGVVFHLNKSAPFKVPQPDNIVFLWDYTWGLQKPNLDHLTSLASWRFFFSLGLQSSYFLRGIYFYTNNITNNTNNKKYKIIAGGYKGFTTLQRKSTGPHYG
jgi:hypothetical protein